MERFRASIAKGAKTEFDDLRMSMLAGEKSKLGWARQMGAVYQGLDIGGKGPGAMEAESARYMRGQLSSVQVYDQIYHGLNNVTRGMANYNASMMAASKTTKNLMDQTVAFGVAAMVVNRSIRFAIEHAPELTGKGGTAGTRSLEAWKLIGKNAITFGFYNQLKEGGGVKDLTDAQAEEEQRRQKFLQARNVAFGLGARDFGRTGSELASQRNILGMHETQRERAGNERQRELALRSIQDRLEDLRRFGTLTKEITASAREAELEVNRYYDAMELDRVKRVAMEQRRVKRELDDENQRIIEARNEEFENELADNVIAKREEQIAAIRAVMAEDKGIISGQNLNFVSATSGGLAVSGREQRREAAERKQEATQEQIKRALENIEKNTEFLRAANVALN